MIIGVVQKVIFLTPSPLRGTPSIKTEGELKCSAIFREESPAPPLFVEEVARSDGGVILK